MWKFKTNYLVHGTLIPDNINLSFSIQKCIRRFSGNSTFKTKKDDNADYSPLKKLLDDSASFEDVKAQNVEQQWATLPYLEGTSIRKQGAYFTAPKHDPRNTTVIMFPGQGSQYVGMAKSLLKFPMARDLFELANYLLGYDILKLCLEGPKEKLDQTKYSQPAILVSSLAAIERLKEERPKAIDNCVATAGFSLGEITALIFAGALDFEKGKCIFIIVIIYYNLHLLGVLNSF